MQRPTHTALRLAAALLPVLAAGGARADGLNISPVTVELTAGAKAAVVEVRNGGTRALRYEITTFEWKQKLDGDADLTPTREIVAFPPVFQLAPGEARNVRIGTTAAASDREKTWRVFVSELPPAAVDAGGPKLQVLTRIGLPVYLEPTGKPHARGEIADVAASHGAVSLTVRNTGNVRIRPESVELTGLDASGATIFTKKLDGWYVLAGGERRYRTELPRDRCAAIRTLVVRAPIPGASIEGAPLESRLAVSNDACAP